jgi:hypothetical protein
MTFSLASRQEPPPKSKGWLFFFDKDFFFSYGYRRIVLALHPDKNPHPKAKDAFTAIQQGFEQLSTLQAYNKK